MFGNVEINGLKVRTFLTNLNYLYLPFKLMTTDDVPKVESTSFRFSFTLDNHNQAFFFTKFLEDLVGPTLRQAEFFVLSFEFFSYSEFFWAEDTK